MLSYRKKLKEIQYDIGQLDALALDKKKIKSILEQLAKISQTFDNSANEIYNVLKEKNKSGWTLGHFILLPSWDETIAFQYQQLLNQLNKKGITQQQLIDLFALKTNEGKTLSTYVLPANDLMKEVYKYLNTNTFDTTFTKMQKDNIIARKIELADYLFTLPPDEKKQALENALNKDHPLGKIFWTQRGLRKPSLKKGVLKTISDKLEKINQSKIVNGKQEQVENEIAKQPDTNKKFDEMKKNIIQNVRNKINVTEKFPSLLYPTLVEMPNGVRFFLPPCPVAEASKNPPPSYEDVMKERQTSLLDGSTLPATRIMPFVPSAQEDLLSFTEEMKEQKEKSTQETEFDINNFEQQFPKVPKDEPQTISTSPSSLFSPANNNNNINDNNKPEQKKTPQLA